MKKLLLLVVIICVSNLYAQAKIINVPGDQSTIQAAINAAVVGDTVLVAEGTYYENINFKGKAIVVASHFLIDGDKTHIDSTIINGSRPSYPDSGSVVTFGAGEDTTSVLYGFTITGGSGNYNPSQEAFGGGGILISNAGATIKYNKIVNNKINHENPYGGGIVVENPNNKVVLVSNTIKDNVIRGISSPYSGGGGIFCNELQSHQLLIANNIVANNSCLDESDNAEGWGGGIHLISASPEIRNNLINDNLAKYGGGIGGFYFPGSEKPIVVNNTIVHNTATELGGGLSIDGLQLRVMNSIFWGNFAPADAQISGNVFVNYSNIDGGYNGIGNINEDPLFTTLDYQLTPGSSPCIDAGNPNISYNDIEDPANPGFPLPLSLGTLRNDMGAYGGNLYTDIPAEYSPRFQTFFENVYSVDVSERQAIADSFITDIESFPFIEDEESCYFIYQGNANRVTIPGDANYWDENAFPMQNIDGTNFWFYHAVFENDARLDYQFIINGFNWILDPLNPKTINSGYGTTNSVLAMPAYIQPTEIEYRPQISHGTTTDFSFESTILNNTRTIRIHTPPGYEQNNLDYYPIMLFHDGLTYTSAGYALNTIDYLISEGLIEPIIGVFIPPVNRDDEYAEAQRNEFSTFIIDELMPYIDSNYRTKQEPEFRAMTGVSYGGLITTQICYQHPEAFGLCAPYSPSYWANDMVVFNEVINGPRKDIKFYVDWGTYEGSIGTDAKTLVNHLKNMGYDVEWNEWHESHSWGSWRAHLDNALKFFFSETVDVNDEKNQPEDYMLSQNYPNPFNPTTTINYSIPKESVITIKVYDILGREVTILVNKHQLPGSYQVEFSAKDFSSGVYFYRLTAGSFTSTKKMILLR